MVVIEISAQNVQYIVFFFTLVLTVYQELRHWINHGRISPQPLKRVIQGQKNPKIRHTVYKKS